MNPETARILQIAPLPPGWHYDAHNRVVGFALVEVEYTNGFKRTELFYLGEDLSLVGAPDEVHYAVGHDKQPFATYDGPDWEPDR